MPERVYHGEKVIAEKDGYKLLASGRIVGILADPTQAASRRGVIDAGYSGSRYDIILAKLRGVKDPQAAADRERQAMKRAEGIQSEEFDKTDEQKAKEMRDGFTKAYKERGTTLTTHDKEVIARENRRRDLQRQRATEYQTSQSNEHLTPQEKLNLTRDSFRASAQKRGVLGVQQPTYTPGQLSPTQIEDLRKQAIQTDLNRLMQQGYNEEAALALLPSLGSQSAANRFDSGIAELQSKGKAFIVGIGEMSLSPAKQDLLYTPMKKEELLYSPISATQQVAITAKNPNLISGFSTLDGGYSALIAGPPLSAPKVRGGSLLSGIKAAEEAKTYGKIIAGRTKSTPYTPQTNPFLAKIAEFSPVNPIILTTPQPTKRPKQNTWQQNALLSVGAQIEDFPIINSLKKISESISARQTNDLGRAGAGLYRIPETFLKTVAAGAGAAYVGSQATFDPTANRALMEGLEGSARNLMGTFQENGKLSLVKLGIFLGTVPAMAIGGGKTPLKISEPLAEIDYIFAPKKGFIKTRIQTEIEGAQVRNIIASAKKETLSSLEGDVVIKSFKSDFIKIFGKEIRYNTEHIGTTTAEIRGVVGTKTIEPNVIGNVQYTRQTTGEFEITPYRELRSSKGNFPLPKEFFTERTANRPIIMAPGEQMLNEISTTGIKELSRNDIIFEPSRTPISDIRYRQTFAKSITESKMLGTDLFHPKIKVAQEKTFYAYEGAKSKVGPVFEGKKIKTSRETALGEFTPRPINEITLTKITEKYARPQQNPQIIGFERGRNLKIKTTLEEIGLTQEFLNTRARGKFTSGDKFKINIDLAVEKTKPYQRPKIVSHETVYPYGVNPSKDILALTTGEKKIRLTGRDTPTNLFELNKRYYDYVEKPTPKAEQINIEPTPKAEQINIEKTPKQTANAKGTTIQEQITRPATQAELTQSASGALADFAEKLNTQYEAPSKIRGGSIPKFMPTQNSKLGAQQIREERISEPISKSAERLHRASTNVFSRATPRQIKITKHAQKPVFKLAQRQAQTPRFLTKLVQRQAQTPRFLTPYESIYTNIPQLPPPPPVTPGGGLGFPLPFVGLGGHNKGKPVRVKQTGAYRASAVARIFGIVGKTQTGAVQSGFGLRLLQPTKRPKQKIAKPRRFRL